MTEPRHDDFATDEVADASVESSYDKTPLTIGIEAHTSGHTTRRPAVAAATCVLVAAGVGGWLTGHSRKHSARHGHSVKTMLSNPRAVTRPPAEHLTPPRNIRYSPETRRRPRSHHGHDMGAATSRTTRIIETTVVAPPVPPSLSVKAAPRPSGRFAPGTFSYLGR